MCRQKPIAASHDSYVIFISFATALVVVTLSLNDTTIAATFVIALSAQALYLPQRTCP